MSLWTADLEGVAGIFDVKVSFPPKIVDRHAIVLVSVCELVQPASTNDHPFKGLAVLTVHNVVPNDGGVVELTIYTGWDSPISVRVHFAINPA